MSQGNLTAIAIIATTVGTVVSAVEKDSLLLVRYGSLKVSHGSLKFSMGRFRLIMNRLGLIMVHYGSIKLRYAAFQIFNGSLKVR